MTQEELGKSIGVTGVTIMRYEKGLREPSLEQVAKLSSVLHVSPSYLVGWETSQLIKLFWQSLGKSENASPPSLSVPIPDSQLFDTDSWELTTEKLEELLAALDAPSDTSSSEHQQPLDVEEEKNQRKASTEKAESELLATQLLSSYRKLNRRGQRIAVERLGELTKIADYQNADFPDQVELPEALLDFLTDSDQGDAGKGDVDNLNGIHQ